MPLFYPEPISTAKHNTFLVKDLVEEKHEVIVMCSYPYLNVTCLRFVSGKYWINWYVPFHLFHFSRKTLSKLLERSNFEITELRYETPSHWVSQSILASMFARPGRQTSQLRSPPLVAALMMFCRFVLFPFLWVGNLTGRGDCLVVVAKKI